MVPTLIHTKEVAGEVVGEGEEEGGVASEEAVVGVASEVGVVGEEAAEEEVPGEIKLLGYCSM